MRKYLGQYVDANCPVLIVMNPLMQPTDLTYLLRLLVVVRRLGLLYDVSIVPAVCGDIPSSQVICVVVRASSVALVMRCHSGNRKAYARSGSVK